MSTSDTKGTPDTADRTILGVLVHPLGVILGIGVLATGAVYLLSDSAFTRANARNALNWHILATTALIGAIVVGFGLETISGLFVIIAALIALATMLLTYLFVAVASYKAITGVAWPYPFSVSIIG